MARAEVLQALPERHSWENVRADKPTRSYESDVGIDPSMQADEEAWCDIREYG